MYTSNNEHTYIYRSETPLIYKAVPSWFIRVEQIIPDLLKSVEETYWCAIAFAKILFYTVRYFRTLDS